MINEYENVLRRLIINIIGKNDNSEYKVSHDRLEKWKEKRICPYRSNMAPIIQLIQKKS